MKAFQCFTSYVGILVHLSEQTNDMACEKLKPELYMIDGCKDPVYNPYTKTFVKFDIDTNNVYDDDGRYIGKGNYKDGVLTIDYEPSND